ncbi:S-layer homology domain-containing protein [Paenibacillus sp. HB172176]|uniref:S-layer homology domain-containing protein n=1 Tax=Paenibacillus sp. HB172176 TaxID=2493690 RepID=UPI00143A041B|nr:S-layer homology domain-containing protein [Paenibacillus sp. HB172176]
MKSNRMKKTALVWTAAMLAGALTLPAAAYAADKPTMGMANDMDGDMFSGAAGESVNAVSGSGGDGTSGAAGIPEESGDASEAKISKEQAEKLIRQYVSVPKEYVLQNTSYGSYKLVNGEQNRWSMDFVKRVNGKQTGSINASIDADSGQLLSFYSYTNNPNAKPTYPLEVDREAAKGLAETFISQVAPDYANQLAFNADYGKQLLPPLSGEVRHQLRFERVVNGIAFPANYIDMEFNSDGQALSFQMQWDDTIEFGKASGHLTQEQAQAAMLEAADPELHYIKLYGGNGSQSSTALSYELPAFAIDAASGERMDDARLSYYRYGELSETPLTDAPLGSRPKPGKISEEQAIASVETAFGKLPAGAELQSSNYNENKNENGGVSSQWYLGWTVKKDGKEVGSISAAVDGSTGTVQSYNQYEFNQSQASTSSSVTLEQAEMKAAATVKRLLPWLTDELYENELKAEQYEGRLPEDIGSYYIRFTHKVHDAIVDYDSVNVTIDALTGEVRSFDANLSDDSYPQFAPKTISAEAATEKWLDYYDTKLEYRLNQQYRLGGQPIPLEKYKLMLASGEQISDKVEQDVTIELVYQLESKPVQESVFLDATTGEWRSRDTGDVTTLELPVATDAEGHWAEESLQLMVAYKALDLVDGKVRPNELITRGELIKMLVLASSGGRFYSYAMDDAADGAASQASFKDVAANSDFFAYVESALDQNLIDIGDGSFNPDANVSRDEMSGLIVRALGYNTLAQYDYIFNSSFKDEADIEGKGQAAIVVGLKIMSLADGKFLPLKKVTRAEASIAFFRYLQKRAELQEAPLRM